MKTLLILLLALGLTGCLGGGSDGSGGSETTTNTPAPGGNSPSDPGPEPTPDPEPEPTPELSLISDSIGNNILDLKLTNAQESEIGTTYKFHLEPTCNTEVLPVQKTNDGSDVNIRFSVRPGFYDIYMHDGGTCINTGVSYGSCQISLLGFTFGEYAPVENGTNDFCVMKYEATYEDRSKGNEIQELVYSTDPTDTGTLTLDLGGGESITVDPTDSASDVETKLASLSSVDPSVSVTAVYANPADLTTATKYVIDFNVLGSRDLMTVPSHNLWTTGADAHKISVEVNRLKHGNYNVSSTTGKVSSSHEKAIPDFGDYTGTLTMQEARTRCQELNNVFDPCEGLGSGTFCDNSSYSFDLISNDEWNEIAGQIESVGSNWSGNSVGSGCLGFGNIGSDIDSSLSSSCFFSNNYVDGSPKVEWEGTSSRESVSKHVLPNGSEIWDLAGNLAEFVVGDSAIEVCNSGSGREGYNSCVVDNFYLSGNQSQAGYTFSSLTSRLDVVRGGGVRLDPGGFGHSSHHFGMLSAAQFGENDSDPKVGYRCVMRRQ